LRSYAYDLLHFLRWWVRVTHTTAITEKTLTESTLLDYIRFQTNQQPQPAAASINRRVGIAERALRLAFPLLAIIKRRSVPDIWPELALGELPKL
jgi:hypothetical protein